MSMIQKTCENPVLSAASALPSPQASDENRDFIRIYVADAGGSR
jgi:hypothetical protein